MYESTSNTVHICRNWTDKAAGPTQKPLINRRVRLSMQWRKRDPCVRRDETMLMDPVLRFRDNRIEMYAKKLSKSNANLRIKDLQAIQPSDPAIASSDSWKNCEEQLLTKLVRIHGSDWELIASQFSASLSTFITGEKTASQLQSLWERIKQTQDHVVGTSTGNFHPSETVFQSSLDPCMNASKGDVAFDRQPQKLTPQPHNLAAATARDPTNPRARPLQQHNPSAADTNPIRNRAAFPSPTISVQPKYASPRLSDWYSDEGNLQLDKLSPLRSSSYLNPAVNCSKKRKLEQSCDIPPTCQPHFDEQLVSNKCPHDTTDDRKNKLMATSSPQDLSDDEKGFLQELTPSLSHQTSSLLTTPIKLSLPFILDDNFFAVQTPTKAICESDQASFHLVSPPSIFGLSAGTGSSASRGAVVSAPSSAPAISLQPRVLFQEREEGDFCKLESSLSCGASRLYFQQPGAINQSPIRVLLPESPQVLSSHTGSSSRLSTTSDPTKRSGPSSNLLPDTDSIALITAKATVWNRRLREEQQQQKQQQKQQQAAAAAEQQLLINRQQLPVVDMLNKPSSSSGTSALSPLAPFPFPPQEQPHLAIRRVIQVGFDTDWRRVALGGGRINRWTTRLARQFLEDVENHPP